MNKKLILLLCLLSIFIGCGKVEEAVRETPQAGTLTISGKIVNGTSGEGPRAKSIENISDTAFQTISAAISGLSSVQSARVDAEGNFSITFNVSASSAGLRSASTVTNEVDLIFTRNGFFSTKESISLTGTEETIDLGLITIEEDPDSADAPAVPTTAGKVLLLKQTRDPNIPYGDDSGRIGPDPNDIYSARQINTDVNIQVNQWYTLRVSVASEEGSARIKAYLNGVLVMDELDPTPYVRDYYSDLRNGNFAIEADAGGHMAYLAIDDVIVSGEGIAAFTDNFNSFNSSTLEGEATWWTMNGSWEVIEEGDNRYLRGETEPSRFQAFLFYPSYSNKALYLSWVNYAVQFRFKLLDSNSDLHFRVRHRFNNDPTITAESAYIGNTSYMFQLNPQ